MNWLSKKWKIPSAFGNEPPQKGLRFDELPRVRELRQKYAQSSDEEVVDGFKNARIIDSVLRFFLYTEARKRGITDKLAQEKHGEKFEFEKDEIIIFRFAETCTRDYFAILFLLFTITIYPMTNYAGIFCALAFSGAVNLCIFLAVWKIIHLSYVTNKRIVINEEENIDIYLNKISSYEVMQCKFEIPRASCELLEKVHSIFYNKHVIIPKKQENNDLDKYYSHSPKEMKYEVFKFCHCEIIEEMIHK